MSESGFSWFIRLVVILLITVVGLSPASSAELLNESSDAIEQSIVFTVQQSESNKKENGNDNTVHSLYVESTSLNSDKFYRTQAVRLKLYLLNQSFKVFD